MSSTRSRSSSGKTAISLRRIGSVHFTTKAIRPAVEGHPVSGHSPKYPAPSPAVAELAAMKEKPVSVYEDRDLLIA